MKRQFAFIVLIGIGLCSGFLRADETQDAIASLNTMIVDMQTIKTFGLHDEDQGRILILEKATNAVLSSISQNGLMNMTTFDSYREMCARFEYSVQFFEFIRTTRTQGAILDLLNTVQAIRKKLNIGAYTTLLKSSLSEMLDAVQAILATEGVPQKTKDDLKKVIPLLGDGIAKGDLGDRPEAFAAATTVYWAVAHLYPELQEISSGPAYSLVLEVLGVNEFIAEYAQIKK